MDSTDEKIRAKSNSNKWTTKLYKTFPAAPNLIPLLPRIDG